MLGSAAGSGFNGQCRQGGGVCGVCLIYCCGFGGFAGVFLMFVWLPWMCRNGVFCVLLFNFFSVVEVYCSSVL